MDICPEKREWAEEKLGLNDSISVQYFRWLENAIHGEFGISYKYKMDVVDVIASRVENTLILGGIGFILIFTLSMLLGVLCAWYEDRWLDRSLRGSGMGIADSKACVYGCTGLENSSFVGATSTNFP